MNEAKLPTVTVLAPCRNEVNFIEKTLTSILENDYRSDCIEVLVIDGISDDGTREVVKKIAAKDSRVKLLDNPRKIVPSAMNIGIKAARGDYIIRIDCHSSFASDYISKSIAVSQRTGADNVGGYIETLPGANTPTAKAIATASSCEFGVGNSAFRTGGPEQEVDTVPFGTFRRDLFEKIGLYDERLVRNQDIELNSRIRKNGGRIIISPEIKLSYYNRATYSGLWQQSFNNGLWNPYTIWLVGSGLYLRHFVPMFFVLSIIILAVVSLFFWPTTIVLTAGILLYFSVATVFAGKASKTSDVSMLKVLWCFFVLHFAYGIGSLWGIITIPFKFPSRKSSKVGGSLANRKQ